MSSEEDNSAFNLPESAVGIAAKYNLKKDSREMVLERETPILVNPTETIPLGEEEKPKHRADIYLARDEALEHKGRYVRKDYNSKEEALRYLKLALEYKQAGVPVPPTMRYQQEGEHHYLVFTDLEADGSKIWSYNNSGTDLAELKLNNDDLTSIHTQLGTIAESAARAGLTMYEDNYFLIKKPTGELQVILGDIGRHLSNINDWPRADKPGLPTPIETDTKINNQRAEVFENRLKDVLKDPDWWGFAAK